MSTAATSPENKRGPLLGVGNIVRFNWPFYALAASGALLLGAAAVWGPPATRPYAGLALLAVLLPATLSLLASWYVYDCSALYRFSWLPAPATPLHRILNIHAGFDETSALLWVRFPTAELRIFDFYDPQLHTEASIRRARAAVAPYPGTVAVQPLALPLPHAAIDQVFALLAAHEIRDPAQRVAFLAELKRVLVPGGRAVVVEHLRDPANFLAYTIGFLHFYSRATWLEAFQAAGLRLEQEIKITPFVSAFILADNSRDNGADAAGNAP
ncbi:class I SAM-dependent methyltransferase [Hymenobacter psychrophilus]|uniref:Methyltransferase domain-containing protein n=1 Tax=Hymenobacter psychrophilus TaxID=651662 RepID=A0A1H3B2V7_9BACT|nr:methyltransferase domain-containing protein [Hymenobacter psychrophilus]SDX36135.1 Methyltransferase domain-containing protein [Hymenobacter psychrophilus]